MARHASAPADRGEDAAAGAARDEDVVDDIRTIRARLVLKAITPDGEYFSTLGKRFSSGREPEMMRHQLDAAVNLLVATGRARLRAEMFGVFVEPVDAAVPS